MQNTCKPNFIKRSVLSLVCIVCYSAIWAQDPLLSIKSSVPLYWNPANTGNELYSRIALNYRNDYPTVGNEYAVYSASFDTYLPNINSGLGIMLMADKFGPALTYNAALLAYSYTAQLSEKQYLRLGLGANLHYAIRDPNKFIFPDMFGNDGSVTPSDIFYEKKSSFGIDFNVGAKYQNEFLSIEASVAHLGSKADSIFWNRPLRLYGQIEFNIPLSKGNNYTRAGSFKSLLNRTVFKPSVSIMKQTYTNYIGLGAYLQITNLNLGLYGKANMKFTSAIFSALLGYSSEYFDINYMIDIGRLSKQYYGMPASSHEVSVIIKIPSKNSEYNF